MKTSKRKKIQKIVDGIGLGILCCVCIYTTVIYSAVKSIVKPESKDYNNKRK